MSDDDAPARETVHSMRIFGHLQSVLKEIEDLQRGYDQMLEDSVLIAAYLGVQANFAAVIGRVQALRKMEQQLVALLGGLGADGMLDRIRTLLELEQRFVVPEAEKRARAEMAASMERACTEPKTDEQIAADDAAEAAMLQTMSKLE